MARSRNIKPGFFSNDVLCELPPLTRLLFAGLWVLADREGRVEDRPKKIRAEVLPYDVCDADEMLEMLEKAGFILRYEAGGERVIQVLAWKKHQNPHQKEAPSTLPAPDSTPTEHQTSTVPTPDKHSASTRQAPGSAQPKPEQAGLIPDSLLLIPDSLGGGASERERAGAPPCPPDGGPPPFPKEFQKFIATERPDLAPDLVFRTFCDHYPPHKRTAATWRKWVLREIAPPGLPRDSPQAAIADPDSRASVEARAVALGLGRWQEAAEQWSVFKARVVQAAQGAEA